jgi:hypothetical protein
MKKLPLLALLCLSASFAFAKKNPCEGKENCHSGGVKDLLKGSGNSGKCSDYEYKEASVQYRGARLYRNGSPCDGNGDFTCSADMRIACNIKSSEDLDLKLKGYKEVNEKWQKQNKNKLRKSNKKHP